MAKRSELRAIKKAGGGYKLAHDAALCLPWAGIFRPREAWRAMVVVAAAAEHADSKPTFYRPANAAKHCKKRSGKLQGLQLSLFPDPPDPNFYRPPVVITTWDPNRPLADIFPTAY